MTNQTRHVNKKALFLETDIMYCNLALMLLKSNGDRPNIVQDSYPE